MLDTLILAQADVPPAGFGAWLANAMYIILSGVGILAGATYVKQLREKKEEMPQPLTVAQHVPYVSRPDFEKAIKEAHGRMNRERSEIDAAIAASETRQREALGKVDDELTHLRDQLASNNTEGERRAEKLHNRINDILGAVSELRGEIRASHVRR